MIKTALLLIFVWTVQPFNQFYGRCHIKREPDCHERLFVPRHTKQQYVKVRPTNRQYSESQLINMGFIDSGATSEVFLAFDLVSEGYYVAKRYFNLTENGFYDSVMKMLKIQHKWTKDQKYHNDIELFPYRNGTNWKLAVLTQFQFEIVLIKVIHKLKRLHEMGFIHMDIKPKNIIISQVDAEIIDWSGVTRYYLGHKMEYRFGTGCYMAPELLMNQQFYTTAVDVWSLGVSLFVILVGQKPYKIDCGENPLAALIDFVGYHQMEAYYRKYMPYKEIQIILTLEAFQGHPGSKNQTLSRIKNLKLRNLVGSMLAVDPEERPSMGELLKNQYFQGRLQFPKPFEERSKQKKRNREEASSQI